MFPMRFKTGGKVLVLTFCGFVVFSAVAYQTRSFFLRLVSKDQISYETTTKINPTPTIPPIRKIWFDWKTILSFIPAKIECCEDLKPKLTSDYPWDFHFNFKSFNRTITEILKAHPVKELIQPEEIFSKFVYKIVSLPWMNVLCDIDFVYGYEQVLLANVKPNSQTYTFTDMSNMWPIKGPMFAYVKYKLRRNIKFIKEKSPEIVEDFLKTHHHCEFMLMGQFNKAKQMEQDILVLSKLANPGGHILIWELNEYSSSVWNHSKRKKLVKEYFSCHFKTSKSKGFAIGHFQMKN